MSRVSTSHPSSTVQRAEAGGAAGAQLRQWSPPIARWWAGPAVIARSACLSVLTLTFTRWNNHTKLPSLSSPHSFLLLLISFSPPSLLSLTLSHSHLAITTSSLPRLLHLPHFFVWRSATARLRCPFEVLFSGLWSFGDLCDLGPRLASCALGIWSTSWSLYCVLESRLWGEAAPAAMATGGRLVAGSHNRNEFIVINADEVGRVSAWKRFLPSRFTDFRPSAQFCDGIDGCFSCCFPR